MQTSYLSQLSQIIFVEKNLSCGEISDFCREFEQLMEFYRKGWLAIAKLKPLSLFISLSLMLKKAFDNVRIEK